MATSLYTHPHLPQLADAPQHVRDRAARITVAAGPDLARQADAWEYLRQHGGDVATRYWAGYAAHALRLALG